MDRKTALTTTAALTLTIAGGVSALFLTIGQAEPEVATPSTSTIVTEYVDQFGNPVDAPGLTVAPTVIVVDENGNPVDLPTTASPAAALTTEAAGYAEGAEPYEDDGEAYEEHEEDDDYDEHEEEGEDHDEYEEEDDD